MPRNPDWNQRRGFIRGEVFYVNFPAEPRVGAEQPRLLAGLHRAVVLFDSTFPRNTVITIPFSSLYENGQRKTTIPSDLILRIADYSAHASPYNGIITEDSFLITNQIRSVSRDHLQDKLGEIFPDDMAQLDLRLITTLNLNGTVNSIVERAIQEELQRLGYAEETSE